jgi:putative phosphoserine phosphatase/1-acylglycerol-3-phosphate O-acyltransferase
LDRQESTTPSLPHTHDIDSGPGGSEVAALFDLDGTLISGFSVFAFLRDRLVAGKVRIRGIGEMAASTLEYGRGGAGFARMMGALARMLRGTAERELRETGRQLFREQLAGALYPEVRPIIEAHRRMGHTLAIASAATRYQVEPVARDLLVPHVLCTQLEIEKGVLTGRVRGEPCWGPGKRDAAVRFARRRKIDLGKSYFYSDGHEDLPLLDTVGHPRPTNPDSKLVAVAEERNWPIRRFSLRQALHATDVARTAALVSILPQAVLTTLPAAFLSDRSPGSLDLLLRGWGGIAEQLAGIDLQIQGEENLSGHDPCVYLFNNASAIDVLIVSRLLRAPFSVLTRARDLTWIERALVDLTRDQIIVEPHTTRSLRALAPAIDALRSGRSVVAAPENTDTPTPRLASFRLAPFRVAQAAQVPIVPIVIHNSRDVLPTGALTIRPGRVAVEVLPAIATDGWQARDVSRRAREVRRTFIEALRRGNQGRATGRWPSD